MISVENLSLSISGHKLLNDISFDARAGTFTAIVGPNGSGKTTLLRSICGDYPYSGTVNYNGKNLRKTRASDAASIRAVLPQASTMTFPFTVREVVALGVREGISATLENSASTLPDRALAVVDLAGFSGRFYNDLSGGEQQRVQLARVLCQVWQPIVDGVPRALLLDEPVSALDIKHQILVMNVARDFANNGGVVIAVLHDLNLASMYADNMIVMQKGNLAAYGRPETVLTNGLLGQVFDCKLQINSVPNQTNVFVLPQSVISDHQVCKV